MIVEIDPHSGFCFGVTSAIRKAEEELQRGELCCLGDIVHNGQECARLEEKGLRTIDYDDLRTLHHARVLLRAHGEPPSTYWIARQRGIEIIDATCPVVKKLQDRIRACYEQHRMDETQPPQIVIYGQRGHAEVIGLQGQTNDTALVIESADEIGKIDFTRPVYLFSQTTKSVEGFQQLVAAIEEAISRQKSAVRLEAHDTICRSVANRVKQLEEFARAHEVVIFVGGKKSSNAKVLYGHCRAANEHTWFVSNEEELTNEILAACSEAEHVGICGATSTPLWLMERCKKRIEKWNTTKSKQ